MKNIQLVQKYIYFLIKYPLCARHCLVPGDSCVDEAKSLISGRKHPKQSFNVAITVIEIITGCHEGVGSGHLFWPKGVTHFFNLGLEKPGWILVVQRAQENLLARGCLLDWPVLVPCQEWMPGEFSPLSLQVLTILACMVSSPTFSGRLLNLPHPKAGEVYPTRLHH